ncbi:MAG TPA: TolC family protein [Nannocystis exedens]|nr:TolC family protein [Nannocystis exedens]
MEASLADVSDLTRINLRVSFAEDSIDGLDEDLRVASAVLVRVVGAPDGTATPVAKGEPVPGLPAEDAATLRQAVVTHPRIEAVRLMSESADERARASRADRYPSIGVGVDWIITGEALDPTMVDSGKDAVVGMAAIKVPLSIGAYAAGENEAKARSRMYKAQELAARNRAVEELERIMAAIRDAKRRFTLYETTMIPLAETSYEAVEASYQSGRANVDEILTSERDLLDLQLKALQARADAAKAWADLERVVGRPVSAKPEERR